MTGFELSAVAAGGFIGAIIRYQASRKLNINAQIPYGTLLVNMLGCLIIGFVFGLELSVPLTFFLVSGVAGALTTFSTWLKEVLGMVRLQQMMKAIGYMIGSVILGMIFVYAGYSSGSFF